MTAAAPPDGGSTRDHLARAGRLAAALVLAALLGACASNRPAATATEDLLSGRLSLRVAASASAAERSATLSYDLRGTPQAGRIDFTTPLGSIVARARWAPGNVVLVTEQGERAFADLDSMSREVLGEVVPVAALFDWLRGRPWPGAPSRATDSGFEQLGWQVDASRLAEASLLVARRDTPPVVTVRAVVDRH